MPVVYDDVHVVWNYTLLPLSYFWQPGYIFSGNSTQHDAHNIMFLLPGSFADSSYTTTASPMSDVAALWAGAWGRLSPEPCFAWYYGIDKHHVVCNTASA